MLALLGGALLRLLPGVGSWLGSFITGWSEDKREIQRLELEMKLEEMRAKNQFAQHRLDADTALALTSIQASLSELQLTVGDRQSARNFASVLHRVITETLATGRDMHLSRWLLSLGWFMGISVEVFTAAVQPMIAATVFTLWATWKLSMLYAAIAVGGSLSAAFAGLWLVEDWMLLEAVIGFFLAGRALVRDRNRGG